MKESAYSSNIHEHRRAFGEVSKSSEQKQNLNLFLKSNFVYFVK